MTRARPFLDEKSGENVVLVDDAGYRIGTAPKASVHHDSTPLHLAFSCYVFNSRNETLLTRRAANKRTWPATWTNACCGHPMPGEPIADAVARRLGDELGLVDARCDLVLPRFKYRAVMANKVVENELCPVFRALTAAEPVLNRAEADAYRWVPWDQVTASVPSGSVAVSPWCVEQVRQLSRLPDDPTHWPTGSPDDLPPAARGTRD